MRRAVLVLALASCDDSLDQRLAIVDRARILAVIAEPPEAKPGFDVTYRAVVATADGPVDSEPSWSFCTGSKPPTEDNAVSTSCVSGDELLDLGVSPTMTATLPLDACQKHGPDTPSMEFRPRDPDPTGGYYQPVRALVSGPDGLLAVGLSRITCKLPNAIGEVARDYDLRYAANQNPVIEPGALTDVRAHAEVTLSASWPAADAETYLYYDQLSQSLVDRREAMRVSWFATGGSIDVDASAVDEDDLANSVSTTWHTPGPGPATVWFVLRDSRGGLAITSIGLFVE